MNHALRWTWLAAALLALTVGGLVALPSTGSASAGSGSGSYPVGSFETHLDGFSPVGDSRVALSRSGAGRHGSRAMVVRTKDAGPATTRSRRQFAGTHAAGTTYVVRAWVRASAKRQVSLQVREVAGRKVAQVRTRKVPAGPAGWRRVKVRVTTKVSDSVLKLRIRSGRLQTSDRLLVDDLRVTTNSGGGGAGTLSNGCSRDARGIPSCGTYVGAAHGSNTDPAALEATLGSRLALRRTYFTSTGVASAVRHATADLAAGRLPWLSFKLPYSWTEMADGRGDAWATDLAQRLAALDGPVWVAFHHEPEGDGDIQEWRRMQEHLAPLVRANASNVAFTVVVTGWNQLYGDAQYRLSEIWPRNVKIDVAGFDIYQQYGVVKNGSTTSKWTDFETSYYRQISTWARSVGVEWGLAETGVTDVAAAARPSEIAATVDLTRAYGGIAYSYFDTTLNSIAPWRLAPGAKNDSFAAALKGSPRLR